MRVPHPSSVLTLSIGFLRVARDPGIACHNKPLLG
jgi:hypothetical protein